MTSPRISPEFDPAHGALKKSIPPNLRKAPITPKSDPPAMKPDAMSVPRENLALFSFSFFDLVVTNHATSPPARRGVLSSGLHQRSRNHGNSWGLWYPPQRFARLSSSSTKRTASRGRRLSSHRRRTPWLR